MPSARTSRRPLRTLFLLTVSLVVHGLILYAVRLAAPPPPAPSAPPVLTAILDRPPPAAQAAPAAQLEAAPVATMPPTPRPVTARQPPRPAPSDRVRAASSTPRSAPPTAAAAAEPREAPPSGSATAVPAPLQAPAPSPNPVVPEMVAAGPVPADSESSDPALSDPALPGEAPTEESASADPPRTGPRSADAAAAESATGPARRPGDDPGSLLPAVKTPRQSGGVRYRIFYGDSEENNLVAQVDYLFELEEGAYRLYTEGRASGLMAWFYRGALVQLSSGTVGAYGLTTQRYLEKRGERATRETTVDPRRGEVVFDAGKRAPAPPGLQDRLSVLVQLALLRQAQPERFVAGAVIELPMLATSSIDRTPWRVIGDEAVTTDGGMVPAVRLTRRSADPRDPQVDVWLALDERLFPVRLRAAESNGHTLEQVLSTR